MELPKFFNRKKDTAGGIKFDPGTQYAVIRSSICTGEKVAGFRERETGRVREVALIHSEADLDAFRQRYGIEGEIPTVY